MTTTSKDIMIAINNHYMRHGLENLDGNLSSIMAANRPFILLRREWNVSLDSCFGMTDRQATERWYGFLRSGYLTPVPGSRGDKEALLDIPYIADCLNLTEETLNHRGRGSE